MGTNIATSLDGSKTARFELVGPDEATGYLQCAEDALAHAEGDEKVNRPLKANHLRKYVKSMTDGEWVLNGETLKIDKDGVPRDGQHRLWAIIESGRTIELLVVHGVDSVEAQDATDVGIKRTVADALAIAGEIHTTALASSLVQFHDIEDAMKRGVKNPGTLMLGITKAKAILEANGGLRYFVSFVKSRSRSLMYPVGLAAALGHIFANASSREVAESFFDQLFAADSVLDERNPIMALKRRCFRDMNRPQSVPAMKVRYRAAITVKAFSAWRNDAEVGGIKWNTTESFPELLKEN